MDKALLHSLLTITFDSASLIFSPILIWLVCILFQVATKIAQSLDSQKFTGHELK